MLIRKFILILFLLLIAGENNGQQQNIDSLRHEAEIIQNDTARILLLSILSDEYSETKIDSSNYFSEQLLNLSRKLNLELNEAFALSQIGYALLNMGHYPSSLQVLLSALAIAQDPKSEQNVLPQKYINQKEFIKRPVTPHMLRLASLGFVHGSLGILYGNTKNYEKELFHYLQAWQFSEEAGNVPGLCTVQLTLGRVYLSLKKTDSALICEQKAYDLSMQYNYKKYLGSILLTLGRIQLELKNKEQATEYFKRAITASIQQNYLRGVVAGNLLLADVNNQSGKKDTSLHYAITALGVAKQLNSPDLLLRTYTTLATFYRSINNNDSTVKYQSLIIKLNDSVFNSKQVQQFQNIDFDELQRQQEIEAAKKNYQDRIQKYLLVAGLVAFLMLVIFLWRNNQQRKRSNALLQQQKKDLENALADLKTMQNQLIQSEKMASLGELTAGIAHEIQNPLNFVNNFSEVNTELIEELKAEQKKESRDIENENKLFSEIVQNLEKIVHHGKRADSIVKGMLYHSASRPSNKELTDINNLADEYLRLAYHGLRAKDKSFNALMKTEFDESIGKINIIPQDIGRVLLNLFNNAFYAVNEKSKISGDAYDPTISVITKRVNGKAEIKVKDNGTGIPQKMLDKIYQPFFTTKPTGQGTGLGLSLSYDIVKAHGGELKVETKEGEYTSFIIQLPVK